MGGELDNLDKLQAARQVVDTQDALPKFNGVDSCATTPALDAHDGAAWEAVALHATASIEVRRPRDGRALHDRRRADEGPGTSLVGCVQLADRLRDAAHARAAVEGRGVLEGFEARGLQCGVGDLRGVVGLEGDARADLQADEEMPAGGRPYRHRDAAERHLDGAAGSTRLPAEGCMNPARGLGLRRLGDEGRQPCALIIAVGEVRQLLAGEPGIPGPALQDRVQLRRRGDDRPGVVANARGVENAVQHAPQRGALGLRPHVFAHRVEPLALGLEPALAVALLRHIASVHDERDTGGLHDALRHGREHGAAGGVEVDKACQGVHGHQKAIEHGHRHMHSQEHESRRIREAKPRDLARTQVPEDDPHRLQAVEPRRVHLVGRGGAMLPSEA
mmetsp:Transcript_107991/g.311255  ORF Transcript_107991/g.311255 Transcript_107991/m.311255 type:complete len:390 (-) Transcript_107991:436-1605(-)